MDVGLGDDHGCRAGTSEWTERGGSCEKECGVAAAAAVELYHSLYETRHRTHLEGGPPGVEDFEEPLPHQRKCPGSDVRQSGVESCHPGGETSRLGDRGSGPGCNGHCRALASGPS